MLPPTERLTLGPGDDCALYLPRGARAEMVFTTDFLLEGVHFLRDTHTAADVGHKALARGLSDLAAMGADPRFCLISLAFPRILGGGWIRGFYRGLTGLAKRFGVEVAGGDLAALDRVVVDIVACGEVPKGKALLRSKARVGDVLYVTGPLGASALGLETKKGAAWKRHRRPEPRIEAGVALREARVECGMDLSDGLSLDLQRMCVASAVGAELEEVPVYRGATLEQALHGGEDYELLYSARPGNRKAAAWGIRIGRVIEGPAGKVMWRGKALQAGGWDHFRKKA